MNTLHVDIDPHVATEEVSDLEIARRAALSDLSVLEALGRVPVGTAAKVQPINTLFFP